MAGFRSVLVSLLAVFCAFGAFGQGTTGSIMGTVTTDGAPLPGVTVSVTSPAMQGTRTAITSENGGYTFAALPPGAYTVVFELSGMQKVTKRVQLTLAGTARADADLKMSGVSEAITVTASAPSVLETTQVSSNFTREQIDNLPVQRDIRNTVLLAPGVNNNGPGNNVMISGAPAYDSTYVVNGVVVNENLRGQPHSLFIEDAIQETTVMTGGISAEYGRFTGGVVSTITKSGGNEFSGSFRDNFSNPAWIDETPFVDSSGKPQADNPDKLQQVYEGTLGGYLFRDRLWFFAGGRLASKTPVGTNVSTQRFTVGTNLAYENYQDEKRYEVKLTGAVTPQHNLIGSYIDITLDETNNAFGSIADVDSIVPTRSLPNTLGALSYNGILTSNFLVEAQYSEKYFAFQNSGGRFTDFIKGTWINDTTRGLRFNAPVFCGVCTPEERNNESWIVKANYFFASNRLGSHTVVAGVENFAEERVVNNYQSASEYEINTGGSVIVGSTIYPVFNSSTRFRYRPILDLSQGTDFQTESAFVNDRWELNKNFSFNLGVRYDKNNGHDSSGNLVSDDSAFSPRLGMIYDIGGDGRFRVNASYSRYVSKIADGNVGGSAQSAGSPALFSYNYTGPDINVGVPNDQLVPTHTALQMLWDWFQSKGGFNPAVFKPNASSVPGFSTRFDEPIASPYVDELNIGFGMRLGSTGFARVDLLDREWGNFYAAQLDTTTGSVTDPYGNRSDQSVTVNSDELERTYRGLQLQAQWQPSRWGIGGSYTWSELKGNDEGEAQGTATSRNTPLGLWYPEYLNYDARLPLGYITGDQRHRARVWASYEVPFDRFGALNLSVLQSYDSGQAYSAVALIDASGRAAGTSFPGAPTNPNNTYLLNQLGNDHNYYIGGRGAFRTDDRMSTDLGINYSLPLGRVSFIAQADVLNLFNGDAVVDLSSNRIDTTVYTRRQRAKSSDNKADFVAFNPQLSSDQLKQYVPGVSDPAAGPYHYELGPLFGQAVSADAYQLPRAYRISLGFRF